MRPDEIGEPNHLYTLTKSVDRLMPGPRLAEQPRVLVVFGGWPLETPALLLNADRSLPPGDRLVTHSYHVPCFTAFVMDVARYRLLMRELLHRNGGRHEHDVISRRRRWMRENSTRWHLDVGLTRGSAHICAGT